MPLANLWGKLNPTNLIAEFVIVTLSVIVALAGDKYLAHRAILEHEQKALELIYEDLKRDHGQLQAVLVALAKEDTVIVHLLRHAASDTTLNDTSVNAGFKDLYQYHYFDRTVASTVNYDAKIKLTGKQIIQSDTLSNKLAQYYDSSLNNLTSWTENRREFAFALDRIISEERGYLDWGSPLIHGVLEKAFHEVLSEMTSNIRIMNAVSLQLNYNKAHAQTLHWVSGIQYQTMDAIEAYFVENDVDYEPFDPEATWE